VLIKEIWVNTEYEWAEYGLQVDSWWLNRYLGKARIKVRKETRESLQNPATILFYTSCGLYKQATRITHMLHLCAI